jgi:hypothetical protein
MTLTGCVGCSLASANRLGCRNIPLPGAEKPPFTASSSTTSHNRRALRDGHTAGAIAGADANMRLLNVAQKQVTRIRFEPGYLPHEQWTSVTRLSWLNLTRTRGFAPLSYGRLAFSLPIQFVCLNPRSPVLSDFTLLQFRREVNSFEKNVASSETLSILLRISYLLLKKGAPELRVRPSCKGGGRSVLAPQTAARGCGLRHASWHYACIQTARPGKGLPRCWAGHPALRSPSSSRCHADT